METRLYPWAHVLVVDDSPAIVDVLTQLLELEGARVFLSGRKAAPVEAVATDIVAELSPRRQPWMRSNENGG